MKPHQVKKAAETFGISIEQAIRMRISYLVEVAGLWDDYLAEITNKIPPLTFAGVIDEIDKLRKYEKVCRKPERPGSVTEEMIQAAKDTPITSVIEFIRGQVACPFHEDKHPSAYNGTRTNRLVCPVCNKTWSAIDILMLRDGMTFIDAVKYLAI